jgi:sec-independent protein translocase protein TatA
MPGFIGFPEILLLGLVVLLVFGPKRLPEMGRSMGRGMREFKDSITGDKHDEDSVAELPAGFAAVAVPPVSPPAVVVVPEQERKVA